MHAPVIHDERENGHGREPAAEDELQVPVRIRMISGIAGHGVARAYGYTVIAAALGIRAELIEGSTRSGRTGLRVAVYAPENGDESLPGRLDSLYDDIAREAETVAAEKRAQMRRESGQPLAGYEVNRFTRAVLAGFAEGAARMLRTDSALRPAAGYRTGSRARSIDEKAHSAGMRAGRAYAERALVPLAGAAGDAG